MDDNGQRTVTCLVVQMYEVIWEEGHVYGNVDELDPTNNMVMHLLNHQQLPMVIVFMDAGKEPYTVLALLNLSTRTTLEQS